MSRDRLFFIVNPAAGGGSTGSRFARVRRCLDERDVSFSYHLTSSADDGRRRAESVTDRDAGTVVAVGGDGTIHSVVSGLGPSSPPLGILPTGSANDFSKALGLPRSVPDALEVLLTGATRAVDVGTLDGRPFVNGLGIGLDGAISRRFQRSRWGDGDVGYLRAALMESVSFEGFDADIRLPGARLRERMLLVSVLNGPVQGGFFRLAPDASVEDGLLDLQVIRNISVFRRLFNLPRCVRGTQARLRDVEIRRTGRLEINLLTRVPVHVDGEPELLAPGTHEIRVVPGGLTVSVPSQGQAM